MTEQGCVGACIWLCYRALTTGENGSSGRLTALPKIPSQSKVPGSSFPTREESCHSHATAQA